MARQATWLDPMAAERGRMVDRQIAGRGIRDPRVLEAMRQVPRELFIGRGLEEFAYADSPLPIAQEQTISQPYVVALMVEAAAVEPGEKVLEIGTGSGYGAAVLGRIAERLYTMSVTGSWWRPRGSVWRGSATATSRCVTATGHWAGPRQPRSTPSS